MNTILEIHAAEQLEATFDHFRLWWEQEMWPILEKRGYNDDQIVHQMLEHWQCVTLPRLRREGLR